MFLNEHETSPLRADGTATLVADSRHIATILEVITCIQTSQVDWLPPLAKLRAGVAAVRITHARMAKYKGKAIGSQHIFREL